MFNHHKAFTAIETLLTLSVIAVTAGMTVPMYRNYQIRNDLDLVTQQTIQGLRRAQVLAQSGESDLSWGFYVQDGVLFAGEAYAVRNTEYDEVYHVPSTINASGISEVTFSRIEGVPNKTGEIILQALNGDQRIIEISTFGVLDVGNIKSFDGGGMSESSEGSTGSEGDEGSTGSEGDESSATSQASSLGTGDGSGDGSGDDSTGGDDPVGEDDSDPTCEDRFRVLEDGTIETTGTVNANLTVLGSEITYGVGGPKIKVTVEGSMDGGETWFDLFNGKKINSGDEDSIDNLTSGSNIVLRIKGRHSWFFNKIYSSNDESGHIVVLRDGDNPPDTEAYANQTGLEDFIQGILDDDRKIDIGEFDAVYLAELGALGASSSDFQDAVILVNFNIIEGSCVIAENVSKFKIDFSRIENSGEGNAKAKVFVGANAIPFSEGQWIPLENAQGESVLDSSIVEDVEGFAVARNSGRLRILEHGSLPFGSKEIVDATISFSHATVTGFENDVNQNKTEEPSDGIVNDGAGGDEVTLLTGSQSVLFQARVTTADDAIFIYWQDGIPVGEVDTDGDGEVDGIDDSDDSDDATGDDSDDGTDDDGGGDTDEDLPDPCEVPITIEDGKITINGPSDVTFRALGSHITYGNRGPEISTYLHASFDDGKSFETLFNYRDIDGGERQTFTDVASGSNLVIKGEGRYSWLFRESTTTRENQNKVRILKRNEAIPGTLPYQNISGLQSFMQNVIDENKYIDISKTSLLFLFELQDSGSGADYQDIAVEVIIEKPSSEGICGGNYDDTQSSSSSSIASSEGDQDDSVDESEEGPKMTICHFPPGNKQNPKTIEIALSAWEAHKSNGDREGTCESDEDGDMVANKNDLCPNTYSPEEVPESGTLLFRRYALTNSSPVFRSGPRKKFVSEFSLNETKGCSCSQLIDVAEGKKTYHFKQFPRLYRNMRSLFPFYTRGARSFGCGNAIMKMIKNYDY